MEGDDLFYVDQSVVNFSFRRRGKSFRGVPAVELDPDGRSRTYSERSETAAGVVIVVVVVRTGPTGEVLLELRTFGCGRGRRRLHDLADRLSPSRTLRPVARLRGGGGCGDGD